MTRPLPPAADLAALYGQYGLKTVSKITGSSQARVRAALVAAGVPLRQRGAAPIAPSYPGSRPPRTARELAVARLVMSLPAGADVARVLAVLAAEPDWAAAAEDLARAARAVRA